ncbi:MAG TPA: carbohydrate binding domain-containing protein [Phycisphaerae bacterium]|nr:carbohydrate binding domain-containing protein [Phycisphaerae bacterium]
MFFKRGTPLFMLVAAAVVALPVAPVNAQPHYPIRFGFMWHMHQPIYYPYETPIQTDAAGRFSYSVVDIHNQRFGPYTAWPRDAIQAGSSLRHLGAQVSFTGSLIENLNSLEAAGVGGGMWTNWKAAYRQAVAWDTSLGNPRLDMVAFGYFHPLMPLLDEQDIRMQIRLHKHIYGQTWTGGPAYSKGIFPAETAFSERIIPALVAEGIQWVIVDNIHFDRACAGYPHTTASNLFVPNRADQINPDPVDSGGAWVQLNNLWAPSRVSAPFGYRPHQVQYVNPDTGQITKMIAVPAARYEGNEDGRGGYGAFLYDVVMDQYINYNTDPNHPMLVILHHDGDNYGGGTDAYYHNNFQNMINWVSTDPDYEVTTVQDYLDRFPAPLSDVIHVENGSWAGADNGDPEFKKWLGDPNPSGWSPDRNSWAVLTAAKNRVFMAEAIAPAASMQNVMTGGGTNTEKAWHWLLCGESSDYWYWDGTEIWDSNVTRACNQAVTFADSVIAGQTDTVPPTVFLPQRDPYNPGGYEWGPSPEPSDFTVWTYAYDVSGLTSVTLKWRTDLDGVNPLSSVQNETYAGGSQVTTWQSVAMTSADVPPPSGILVPTYRALRYSGMITGQNNVLIDYYVEAVDTHGNVARSDIQHVWVGQSGGSGGGDVVTINPNPAVAGQNVTIKYNPSGRPLQGAGQVYLHYGFNHWNPVISPDPAMTWNATESVWQITVMVQSSATQLDMVFNNGSGTWDNNDGADWHFTVSGGTPPPSTWTMDGQLDADATLVAANGGLHLYAGVKGNVLYVASEDAGEGNDHFIFMARTPGALRAAPWAKAGQVATWDAYLANENDNLWRGWFDASGTVQTGCGTGSSYLEGTINLVEELGSMPEHVYLAMAPYPTADGSSLLYAHQVPASIDGNGNIDAGEYATFDTIRKGDITGDWRVDAADLSGFVAVLLGTDTNARHVAAADMNSDGAVDGRDVQQFVSVLVSG